MSLMISILASITVGMIFSFSTHPLAMGLILLAQTTTIALLSGLILPSFWFSYILFLVFLGGMLVLFIYVASLASNEMFSLSPLSISLLFTGIGLMLVWALLLDNNLMMAASGANWEASLSKLYSTPSCWLTLTLINYLLLTLIVVVSITRIQDGPLRPGN